MSLNDGFHFDITIVTRFWVLKRFKGPMCSKIQCSMEIKIFLFKENMN